MNEHLIILKCARKIRSSVVLLFRTKVYITIGLKSIPMKTVKCLTKRSNPPSINPYKRETYARPVYSTVACSRLLLCQRPFCWEMQSVLTEIKQGFIQPDHLQIYLKPWQFVTMSVILTRSQSWSEKCIIFMLDHAILTLITIHLINWCYILIYVDVNRHEECLFSNTEK